MQEESEKIIIKSNNIEFDFVKKYLFMKF